MKFNFRIKLPKLPGIKLPKIGIPRIKLGGAGKIFRPRVLVPLVVIAAVVVVAMLQARLKEKLFKKPAAAEKAMKAPAEGEAPQEPILVKTYKIQKKDFEDTLPLLGTIKGYKEIGLKFEATGIIESFNFKEGERIEEGEIIATLNQKDALLKIRYNEIEADKIQKLFDIGAINSFKLEQAKLELESSKRELDKTYLYAPRSGALGTKDAEVGELVNPNDKIGTLIDSKEVFAEVGIIEKDVGKVKLGQTAVVTVDTYPDIEFSGTVDNIAPVIEGKSRTQTAKIKVKNPEGQLLPGMFARVSCAVYKAQGAVVIPNSALDKTEEGYVTYVVKKTETPALTAGPEKKEGEEGAKEEEGAVEARPIKAAYRSGEFFVVKEGLEEGELVVVETQEKLKDGVKVIVTETQEALF
ncbi:MAG: efflux RND transporter periplasmic adaptor subunit [Candidatus Omnitrophica bacterium]|nr:efflux RND transporter periplasmic adaptor subunit [Candidatus Omnitrophota bacterium]